MTSSPQTIGIKLKTQREKKQMTIDDVHLRLRIHPESLRRLEENQFTQWPGGAVYVRGFLKQYSDFLGLNTSEILVEYDQLGMKPTKLDLSPIVPSQAPSQSPSATKKVPDKPSVDITKAISEQAKKHQKTIVKWSAIVAVIVVTLWLGTATVRALGSAFSNLSQRHAAESIKKKEARDAARAQKAKESEAKKLQTEEKKRQTEEKKRQEAEKKSERKKSMPGQAKPVQPVAPSGFLNSPDQGNFPKLKSTDALSVTLSALTDIWMRVSADNQVVFESILKEGEKLTWKADNNVDFKFGRPEGADLTVNGYHVGTPGNGKISRIQITQDGIRQAQ